VKETILKIKLAVKDDSSWTGVTISLNIKKTPTTRVDKKSPMSTSKTTMDF